MDINLGLKLLRKAAFREKLLRLYNYKCSICNDGPINVLEACHILPHSFSGNNRLENGLILRADLHCLFDDGLLKINPKDYSIEIDDSIMESTYRKFNGKRLRKRMDGSYPERKLLRKRYNN